MTQNADRRCPCYFCAVSMEDLPLRHSGFLGGLSSNSLYCLGPNVGLEAQASQSSRLSKAHRAGHQCISSPDSQLLTAQPFAYPPFL